MQRVALYGIICTLFKKEQFIKNQAGIERELKIEKDRKI